MTDFYGWRLRDIENAENLDVDVERDRIQDERKDESPYPGLCGVLQYHFKQVTRVARGLYDELIKVENRKSALEWAAEHVLNSEDVSTHDGEEVYELLYAAANVIEHALNNGWDDDKIRKRLRNEIEDDEIAKGRFIDADERCNDCEKFIGNECDEERCEECQEIYEEAIAQTC